MSLTRILERLLEVEQLAAELYGRYAAAFADVAPARELFTHMKEEELNHKNQVHLQIRIIAATPSAFDVMEVDMSSIDQLVAKVKTQITRRGLTLKEALDFAIFMESNALEATYRTAVAKHNIELSKLVRMLTAGDEQHMKNLKNFRARL